MALSGKSGCAGQVYDIWHLTMKEPPSPNPFGQDRDRAETMAQAVLMQEGQGYGRGFRFFLAAVLLNGFAVQIQTVAIGWQLYILTKDPLDLGLVGLSQFAPALVLMLVIGVVVDRYPRRLIIGICFAVEACVAAGLLYFTLEGYQNKLIIFGLITVFGTARAFYMPARQSLLPNLVPQGQLQKALALNSSLNQIATICGPVAGGFLLTAGPWVPYVVTLCLLITASALTLLVPKPAQSGAKRAQSWAELTAGFRYIWSHKLILGAISLDLFVVLLGGATALLPVFAADVLHVGEVGLGFLRMAPAVGALGVAIYLTRYPLTNHVGRVMFSAVAVFAIATLVFALSKSIWLSVLALAVTGMADMLSVVIRGTLVQIHTPDAVRGRVSAVSMLFIGASNEVGAFRAGSMASGFGAVGSLAFGAIASLGICLAWTRLFPSLRDVRDFGQDPR